MPLIQLCKIGLGNPEINNGTAYIALEYMIDMYGNRVSLGQTLSMAGSQDNTQGFYDTPEELLAALRNDYGYSYIPPRTRYTAEQLNIIQQG